MVLPFVFHRTHCETECRRDLAIRLAQALNRSARQLIHTVTVVFGARARGHRRFVPDFRYIKVLENEADALEEPFQLPPGKLELDAHGVRVAPRADAA